MKAEEPPKAPPYSFHPGASWLTLDGTVFIVPGFHEEWIRTYQEFMGPQTTVADVILNKRWLSLVVYSQGYLEVYFNRCEDREVVEVLWTFLNYNQERWLKALLMPLIEEKFIKLARQSFIPREQFVEFLLSESRGEQ